MQYKIVISGPSGAGKGTLINLLLNNYNNFVKSVSCTTRNKRVGEKDSEDYFFVSKENFIDLINKNSFFETVIYDDNFYGILNEYLNIFDKDVLFDVVVDSGLNIKSKFPNNTILIYILPKDLEILNVQRGNRGENRLYIGLNEIENAKKYEYIIINDSPESMLEQFKKIYSVVCNNTIKSKYDFLNSFYNKEQIYRVRK